MPDRQLPWDVTDNVVIHPSVGQDIGRVQIFHANTDLIALSDGRVAIPHNWNPPRMFREKQIAVRRRRLDAGLPA